VIPYNFIRGRDSVPFDDDINPRTTEHLLDNILTIPGSFNPQPSTLANRTVLVSAAASDSGRAVCLAASAAGATVLMLDQKQRYLAPIYDEVCAQGFAEPMMIEFDLLRADPESFDQLSSSLAQAFPEVHGLVHCAIWGGPLSPLVNSNPESWSSVYLQQLVQPMLLTRSLAPLLNHGETATIVFTVMDTGRCGRAYWGSVGAAFAAVENLSETLAAEFGQYNTRSNTLDPGRVRSAIRAKFYPGENGSGLREPDDPEIMRHYLYLLSDESREYSARRFSVPSLD
jgi:NAD(P)-dependent dehydrogenase (short-subunit alcohol dehydrogenase family)